MVILACRRSGEHVGQTHQFAVRVRDLDADRGLAGDRREQAHVVGGHGVGDVAGERGDLLDLHAGSEFHLVPCDRRAAGEARDRGVDLELFEHLGDGLDHLVVRRTVLLGRIALEQQPERRQSVVALHHPVGNERLELAVVGGFLDRRDRRGSLLGPGAGARRLGCRIRCGFRRRRRGGRRLRIPHRQHLGAGVAVEFVRRVVLDGGTPPAPGTPLDRVAVGVEQSRVVLRVVVVGVVRVVRAVLVVGPIVQAEVLAEHPGQFPDRRAGEQQDPEPGCHQQQRHRQPHRQTVGEGPAHQISEEAGAPCPARAVGGHARGDVPQAERGEGDEYRPQDEPGPDLRPRLGAHEDDRDHETGQRQHGAGAADERADRGLDPAAERAADGEPDAAGDDDARGDEPEGDAVAAVAVLDLRHPAHRAGGGTHPAGDHRPAGADPAAERLQDARP